MIPSIRAVLTSLTDRLPDGYASYGGKLWRQTLILYYVRENLYRFQIHGFEALYLTIYNIDTPRLV